MRRPFALIGFTYLFVLLCASYIGFGAARAVAVLFAAFGAAVFFGMGFLKYRMEVTAVLCSAALALGAFCAAESFWYSPAVSLAGRGAVVTGKISDLPVQSNGNCYYIINAENFRVSGTNYSIHTKVRLQTAVKIPADVGDTVTFSAMLSQPVENGGDGFDSRAFYKAKDIYLFGKMNGYASVTPAAHKPLYYYAVKLRESISGAMQNFIGGTAGSLADGILIGDTTGLPDSVKTDFSTTGISHILAVSGTQTSLIAQYLLLIFAAFKLPKRLAATVSAVTVLGYMAVTGFSPSVMRAGIMAIVYLGGIILRRDADTLNSLGFSSLLMCLVNPYAARDVGLLLSFTATLGMITLSGSLSKRAKAELSAFPSRVRRIALVPAGVLCETIGASVFTYPVIILIFGKISVVSLFSNMLEVPVSLFVTLAAAMVALLAPLKAVILIKPLAILIRISCDFMVWFAGLLASLPFASVSTGYGYVGLFLVYMALAAGIFLYFRDKGANIAVFSVCVCFTLAVGICSLSAAALGVLDIAVIENSGGESTILTMGSKAVIIGLSTKNPREDVESYLRRKSINKVDALIMTSFDKKKVAAADVLLADMPVDSVYIPSAYSSRANHFACAVGVPAQMSVLDGVQLVLLPDKSAKNLVLMASYGSSRAVVAGEYANVENFGRFSLRALKAGLLTYSGDVSEDFLSAVSPEYGAGGGNGSGQTLAALKTLGCQVSDSATSEFLTRGNGKYRIGG